MATQTEPFRGRIFQEEDLYSILKRVRTAAPKWRWVGLALGFKDSVLDEIEATDKDPKECFRKVLSRWLKWAKPNHDPPSSRSLAEALRSEMVEEERLAKDLEQYFSETDTQHTVMVDSHSPKERTSLDYDVIDTQHTVMVESPRTPKPRVPFSIYHDCYLWGYAGRLRWDSTNEDPRAPLVRRYLKLTESVREALEKKGITAEEIWDVLCTQSKDEGKAYMESVLQQGDEIQRAADIQEVLAAVTSHSSKTFLDYKPLELLIKKFKLTEAENELERYKKDLQQFLRENIPHPDPLPLKRRREESEPETEKKKRKLQCSMM